MIFLLLPVKNWMFQDLAINLHGLRFSRVTQKTERMNRTVDNIHLPVFPKSVAQLLEIKEASNFCFVRFMDIHYINAETVNIHYTAHQFWSKNALKSCCWISLKMVCQQICISKNSNQCRWSSFTGITAKEFTKVTCKQRRIVFCRLYHGNVET